jgi:hypothetical protein
MKRPYNIVSSINLSDKEYRTKLFLFTITCHLLLFLINPFFSVLFLIFYLGCITQKNKYDYILLFVFLSIFLGLINTTKIPESDLLNYQDLFAQAGTSSLNNYLISFGKEPAFSLFTYFCYYIFSRDFKLYVLCFSFISYFFLFQSIYLFYKKFNQSYNIIFAVLLIAFFSEQFGLSAHLVRQFLAGSLMMYYLINKAIYHNNKWLLLIFTIFIHSSALFFVPLIFLPFFKNKIKGKALIFLSIFLIIISIAFSILNSYLLKATQNLLFINYIFTRTSAKISDVSSGQLNMLTFILIAFLILVTLYIIYFKKAEYSKTISYFYNIFLGLSIFILCTIDQPLLSLRFFFYVYFFMPFILPFAIPRFYSLRSFLILILLIRFGLKLETGIFKYDDILTLITNNFFSYFKPGIS